MLGQTFGVLVLQDFEVGDLPMSSHDWLSSDILVSSSGFPFQPFHEFHARVFAFVATHGVF